MINQVSESIDKKYRVFVGIAVARFNEYITDQMLERCIERLNVLGVDDEFINVARAPGSFELPLVARKLAAKNEIDVVIALGAVIRGETPHFEHVSNTASSGILKASEDTGKPIIFGVLTCNTVNEAVVRIEHSADYANAALQIVRTCRLLEKN